MPAPQVRPSPRVAAHLYLARLTLGDTLAEAAWEAGCRRLDVAAAELGEPLPVDALMDLCRRYRVPPGWVAEGAAALPRRLA